MFSRFFRRKVAMLALVLLAGCTREVIKQDKYLQSQKELSRTVAVQSASPSYKTPSYPLKVYSNVKVQRNYSLTTIYKKVPPSWLQFVFWGGAVSSAGAGYWVGNTYSENGRVVLGRDIMLSGAATGLVMMGGYYLFSLKNYRETRPYEETKIESTPLVSQRVTISGPPGLGFTWYGQTTSKGELSVPWNFLRRAARSLDAGSLRFEVSSSGLSSTSFNLLSSQILSVTETRNNASGLLQTAKENIRTGDISAAIENLQRVEDLVPRSDLAAEVSRIRKEELPRATLRVSDLKLLAKLGNLLSTMELLELLYRADNLSADNALVVMSQGFGYRGLNGYAAYQQLSSPQKLFAVMYFASLVTGSAKGSDAWLVRATLYKEYLGCSNAVAGKLGRIEPMSIFE